jgi:protease I
MPTTSSDLSQIKVAVLCTDGVENSELIEPVRALRSVGATVEIISPKKDNVESWKHFEKAEKIDVDQSLDEADADQYDALVPPGGVANPDQLRMIPKAVQFVQSFAKESKPIASICHGPWLLAEAGVIKGKRLTSWPSIKTDLINAGAKWSDDKVVRDDWLVTSRKPADLPDFNREMIRMIAEIRERASAAKKARSKEAPHISP